MSRRKKILLFLSIFLFLLIIEPAAYVQCTHILPDQIMDVLRVVKYENALIGENKINALTARSILYQDRVFALSWQEYYQEHYIQASARSLPMWGIVIWGIRTIRKKDSEILKLSVDPDSFSVNNLSDVRKVQYRKHHQASLPFFSPILRI
jgi:hypothetical protein